METVWAEPTEFFWAGRSCKKPGLLLEPTVRWCEVKAPRAQRPARGRWATPRLPRRAPLTRGKALPRARLCPCGVLLQAPVACLPLRSTSLSSPLLSSPDQAREEGERAGGEMGSDSSPKKWNLKEQRNTYLQWFSLADEGLLRDPSRPLSNYFALSCGSMNAAAKSDLR